MGNLEMEGKNWKYFEKLDRILGRRPASKPHPTFQSGKEVDLNLEIAENSQYIASDLGSYIQILHLVFKF